VGYKGIYGGKIGDMGDCRHIDAPWLAKVALQAGNTYALNVTGLHESLPIDPSIPRTIVRINVPGWSHLQ
jgi:hypothetical protein